MSESITKVLSEINKSFEDFTFEGYPKFLSLFEKDGSKIVCCGAGRVGLALRGFTMRLSHLGINAHFLGETVVPKTGPGDLMIVGSGSGSTRSILKLVEIAKERGIRIGLVTSNEVSPMGKLADAKVVLSAPNKNTIGSVLGSVQPMTTLFEQALAIFLDATVLDLMNKFGETSDSMWERHNGIE